jgi:deoxyribodipyrimidine photo-lyase
MRFGLVSIRQIYQHYVTQKNAGADIIISELAWREFRHHVMHYFPNTQWQSFQEKRRKIQRENNHAWFTARCEGKTGYPIIDAAMRQLKAENRMHNRARMIVASFLTKDLLIDRTRGEKHFANYLIDYDHAVNIGNRQRSASVGADPKPLRIFSPILQAQRFDPDAAYIKKYIPELADVEAYRLHDPLTYTLPYIVPIVDHRLMQQKAKDVYRAAGE